MGLQIRRSPSVKFKVLTTVIAVLALVAQPLYSLMSNQMANAATDAIPITPGSLSITGGDTDHSSADASSYHNLKLSFNYNVENLDNSDKLVYSWSVGSGASTELGQIEGHQETGTNKDTDETGMITDLALPDSAAVDNLQINFDNNSDSSTSDTVTVSNISLTGVVATPTVTPPTVVPCTSTSSVVTTDLRTWDLSQTRMSGHNELTPDGLHIWTDGATSTDKAAGYYPANFPLSGFGDQTIADSMSYVNNGGGTPGLQLVVDLNNDGTIDGHLVGEAIYGNSWWLSDSTDATLQSEAPRVGGGGSAYNGTLNQWLAAFPNAQVKQIGYSLGSGVKGDGIITKLTAGCTNYTFALPLATPKNIHALDNTHNNYASLSSGIVSKTVDPSQVDLVWDGVPGADHYITTAYLNGTKVGNPGWTGTPNAWVGAAGLNGVGFGSFGDGTYTFEVCAYGATSGTPMCTTSGSYIYDATSPSNISATYTGGLSNVATPTSVDGKALGGNLTFQINETEANPAYMYAEVDWLNPTTNKWEKRIGSAFTATSGTLSLPATAPSGTYQIKVSSIRDAAGNTSPTQTFGFTIDNTAPTLSNVKFSQSGTTYITDKSGIYVTFTASEPLSGLPAVTFDGVSAQSVKNTSGNNYAAYLWMDGNLPEGPVALSIDYTDAVGNKGQTVTSTTDGSQVIVDRTAPKGTFTYSNNNDQAVTNQPVTITLTTNEPINQPVGWDGSGTVFTKQVTQNVKDSLQVEDRAGNTASLSYEVKRIDTTLPVIGGVSNGNVIKSLSAFTITDQNFDQYPGGVMVDGNDVTCTYSGSSWVWNCPAVTGNGSHVITALDKAGNSTTVTFTIDTTAPQLSNFTINPTVGGGYLLSVVTNDPASPVSFMINGGSLVAGASNDGGTTWTYVISELLASHTYTLGAVSIDGVGNSATISQTYTVPAVNTSSDLSHVVLPQATNVAAIFSQPLTQTPVTQPPAANNNSDTAVLGTKTKAGDTDTSPVAATSQGWKIFGIAWYWILIVIAIVGSGIWWTVVSLRRRALEDVA